MENNDLLTDVLKAYLAQTESPITNIKNIIRSQW